MHLEYAYYSFFLIHLELKRYIRSCIPSKTMPEFRPKKAKSIPPFRPKRPKDPTLWGSTYLKGKYKGVSPPPPPPQIVQCGQVNLVHRGQTREI